MPSAGSIPQGSKLNGRDAGRAIMILFGRWLSFLLVVAPGMMTRGEGGIRL